MVLPAGDFNPRSHKGSDRSWPASRRGSETNFNPRSHKGSDRYLSISVRAREFQSTLPQGERRESGSQMCLVHRDFNPRSHKGSDGTDRFIQVRNTISIHAPTRGATTFPPARYGHPGRFQSTLPQGERLKNSVGNRLGMNFNPRSHKGSDRSCGERGQPDIYFNPRSHKGSDPVAWMPLPVPYIFQSTLPQGERLPFLRLEGSQTNFNPRSHKGSDIGALVESGIMTRFQSTLPQGERQLYSAYILSNILYFNPRSHKGSDRGCGLSLVWFG